MEIRSDIAVLQIQKRRVTGESICHSNRHTMEQLNSLQIPWPVFLLGLMWGFPTVYHLHPKMFLYRCQLRISMLRSCSLQLQLQYLKKCLRLSSQDRCSTTASPFSQHVHVSCCLLYNNHNVGVAPGLLNLCSVQR